jgi:endo-1,4-beta-xylanase
MMEIRKNYLRESFILCLMLLSYCMPVHAQLANGKCRYLGNIISSYTPSDFSTYWNQVTPENAGKWGSVEATRDVMNWGPLDNAYNTAKTNGIPFKQHTFVWGQQQPNWINSLSAQEQREEVEEWIKLFCERYPDTDFIDVVNEPLHAVADYSVALGGGGATGWDWVVWTFEKAKQYCPKAKRILNDYNIINNDAATTAYLTIINILKEGNLIDIIGEQGHFLESTPNNVLLGNLNRLHATGLPIHISEYDVNLTDVNNAQRDKYMSQFPVLWTHPGVQGITLWGYKEGEIWRTDAYLLRQNGTERPALTWLKNYMTTAPGGSFCLVTGIEEAELSFNIYPNPSRDGKITVESDEKGSTLVIRDMTGREVRKLAIHYEGKSSIELENPAGVYIFELQKQGRTTRNRLLIAP